MSKPQDPFQTIDADALSDVAGGASRVTARSNGSNDQLMTMMSQITDSIKQLTQGNQNDPMQMMMMMMMMGGMGGGGGSAAAAAPPPPPAPPVINITTTVKHRPWWA